MVDHNNSDDNSAPHAKPHRLTSALPWSYCGDTGPKQWAMISENFSACNGMEQSPIDIIMLDNNVYKRDTDTSTDPKKNTTNIEFKYGSSNLVAKNKNHTVQLDVEAKAGIKIGVQYHELLQFHFHSRSEHSFDGVHSPLELHLVHKNRYAENDLAVVGVMIEEGHSLPFLDSIISLMTIQEDPIREGKKIAHKIDNLMTLIPRNHSYYAYGGSLTTPPCTEGVKWYIMKDPIFASSQQIQTLSEILDGNSRPVQKTNNREVRVHIVSDHM